MASSNWDLCQTPAGARIRRTCATSLRPPPRAHPGIPTGADQPGRQTVHDRFLQPVSILTARLAGALSGTNLQQTMLRLHRGGLHLLTLSHSADATYFTCRSPAVTAADALRTAAALHAQLTERLQCDARTVAIGLATSPNSLPLPRSIGRSRVAADAVGSIGQRGICFWNVTRIGRLIRHVCQRCPTSNVEHRLTLLLERLLRVLGPTQWSHLTAHSLRVAALGEATARALGRSDEICERVRLAGRMHDLGKAVLPEALLAKPAALDPAERQLVNRHAADGAQFARLLGLPRTSAAWIRHHHCRYDRRGDGTLRPVRLEARILAVADAYITMTTHRPYQAARTPAEALAELARQAARQFDPAVVATVARIVL